MAQQVRHCSCGTRLAHDNQSRLCTACQRQTQSRALTRAPTVPDEFWRAERMREALASWHMGKVFYAYRTHPHHGRALSQESVAGWLGLNQAQLSRIENGAPPQDLGKLMSWAHSLGILADLLWFKLPHSKSSTTASVHESVETLQSAPDTPAAGMLLPVVINGRSVFLPLDARTVEANGLGGLLDPWAESADARSATERDTMSPLNRRTVLKSGIAAAALPGLGLDDLHHIAAALQDARRYLDGPVIAYFRTQLEQAKRADGARGPKKTLPAMLGLLGAIEQSARDVKPAVRQELLSVGADGAEFVGWLYRDIHQPTIAGFWYDRAMEWAQEANDPAMQGYVLLKKSQMAYDERDALRLLTLAQAARHDRWNLPVRVQAEATQQEALGYAMLGEPLHAVQQKLDDAHSMLTGLPDGQPDTLGSYFAVNTLLLRNAVTYTEAGKPSLASDLFSDVIASGSLSNRDAGFFNARRAAALALSGEPDEAARVGKSSADVALEMKSERTIRVLSEVLHTLSRWSGRPAVRAFRKSLCVA
ncbi:XRE family transcriptional regulator [Streptomyces sp. NPDC126933]|uniref:XRE family transcriptional regulator n=1 Tax=unclassified Streptomyces TaxID=2593676 RepID=UPI00366094C0